MKNNEHTILVCECNSTEHQIVFMKDEDDGYIYCCIHLSRGRFWKRLKNGIKYIFGYRCKYGDFDEIILSSKHKHKIKEMYDFLEKSDKK